MKKLLGGAALGILLLEILSRTSALPFLLSSNYLPHSFCYLAQPWLIWANVTMDGLIAASYVIIFAVLFWIVAKLRKVPEVHAYLWVPACFGAFILACAGTHLMEGVTIWWPVYRLTVAVKVVCAAASIATAVLFSQGAANIVARIGQFIATLSLTQREHASDITRRKQAEEMRERLAAVVESSEDAIMSNSLEGKILAWNRGAEKLFGYSPAEAVSQSLLMLTPAEQIEKELDILARIGRGESLEHFETVRVRKDGARIDVSVTISLIRDGNGKVVGFSRISRDISERKRAESRLAEQAVELGNSRQALEAQKLLLQSVLNSMGEGLIAADEQGKFILWNPAAEKIVGLGAAKLSPKDWSAHYGAYLPDKVTTFPTEQNPLFRAMGGEVSSAEIFLRNPGLDQEVWIEANGAPLRDQDGVLRGGVIAFRNITQKKADELEILRLNEELEQRIAQRTAQLQEANQELEAFTYSVSHDLRAPLRHIGGFSKILLNNFGPVLAEDARDLLQRIEDAVLRMGKLVDGLLSLAKLGRKSLTLQPNELNAILDEVVAILQPACAGREVEWRIAQLPALQCDAVLIGQVFQNLLDNALKYSRGRTKAVIEIGSIQRPGEPPVIFVRDNGAGFNMKYADRLFGVFQRLHTEAEFEGTGAGLATVQRIIKKHGGKVWAEAEVGKGATFFFTVGGSEPTILAQKVAAAA